MTGNKQVICIGSVLWDVIGRTEAHPGLGGDVGGRIRRLPGGVAMKIAMTLAPMGVTPVLLTSIGLDDEGNELISRAEGMGMETGFVHRTSDLRTDIYMAVECGQRGLVAAIADAHSLEAAGEAILAPLLDGRLGSVEDPFTGTIALDGNLTAALLTGIAGHPALAEADLRVAPASPGKAARLIPLAQHGRAMVYVNREEAQTICGAAFDHTKTAAEALVSQGFSRAMVSDGAHETSIADHDHTTSGLPPSVEVRRVTGAGDTLMAAHIAAELDGRTGADALTVALNATADYISRPDT